MKIMFLSKRTMFCKYASKILESYYPGDNSLIVTGDENTQIEDELLRYSPEYIVSYLSPWILPEALLSVAQKASINFHPGSPLYPGSHCYNFAIYEKAKIYGVTCHHMKAKVDTGDIIMTSHFHVSPEETVQSLKVKAMNHLLYIFEKVVYEIYENDTLPESNEKWLRKPFTKKQFNELRRIDPFAMDNDEMMLRIRATDYCSKYEGAFYEVSGKRLCYKSSIDEALV